MGKEKVSEKANRRDIIDIMFRVLFSLIFLALGAEHLFSDQLIQKLMPDWMPVPRLVSILTGLVLLVGGGMIALGFKLRLAATSLIVFLLLATILVHGANLMGTPEFIDEDHAWLWAILQRSNYAKNICLIGVCLRLLYYTPGRWSLEARLASSKES